MDTGVAIERLKTWLAESEDRGVVDPWEMGRDEIEALRAVLAFSIAIRSMRVDERPPI